MIKRAQLVGSVSPGRVSRRRRNHWPSVEAALEHFRHKRPFMRWNPQMLRDYVEHCTHEDAAPGGAARRVLDFDPGVETAIYNTLPHNLDRLLSRHPLQCPVAFIGGTRSQEMRQVGMAMTLKVIGREHPERIAMVTGSHLFPMERPLETSAAIEAMLRRLHEGG